MKSILPEQMLNRIIQNLNKMAVTGLTAGDCACYRTIQGPNHANVINAWLCHFLMVFSCTQDIICSHED